MRTLGKLWPVSSLTIGGAGLGQLWGSTTRDEAVATLREAIAAGITCIDVAPRYGDGEAERAVGAAFEGKLPRGVRISTKCRVSNPPASEVFPRLERSLGESLERMRLSFVDLFILHGYIVEDEEHGGERRTPRRLFTDAVRPALERLVKQGRIGAWGMTAVGLPGATIELLAGAPPPGAIQAIANALDSPGDMKWFKEPARSREIIAEAHARSIGVMAIRAVAAGALTDALDRVLSPNDPIMADFRDATPFRALARDLGEPAASLAHRYALSMAGVDTVVIGVKNRIELRDCLGAASRGRLPAEVVRAIDSRLRRRA